MTLPQTQALKDRLRDLSKKGESFSRPGMGVGQEFVSIVNKVEQESVGIIIIKRGRHTESPTKHRVE